MADSAKKRELIAQLDRARSKATAFQRELKEDLRLGDKVHEVGDQVKDGLKESVNQHRGIWLGASALVGLLISKIPPRTKVLVAPRGGGQAKKEVERVGKASLLVAALGWLFNLVRPMLISWGTQRIKQAMAGSGNRGYRRI